MSSEKISITPKTKIRELLESFTELEQVLIEMSPAFEKLKNPILRKTVARVATIQQVSVIGGLNADEIVNRLRKEAGQSTGDQGSSKSEYLVSVSPDWLSEEKIIARFDASPIINSGGSPMSEILHQANHLKDGEIFELRTPFVPAPIIDILKEKAFKVCSIERGKSVTTFIMK